MGSGASSRADSIARGRERPGWFTSWMLLYVWIPIALIGVLHYTTHAEQAWAHNVLRRVYYLPIVLAAFHSGLRGGLVAAAVVSLTYLPHAFGHAGHLGLGHLTHLVHMDPGDAVDKALELVLYNVVGGLAGHLADRDRRRRSQLQAALDEQQRLQRILVRAGRLSALGEVVAGIAHEIKNPIHSLRGTAEVVDAVVPRNCEERRLWELHVAELERLSRVADRFLSFSSPREPERVPLDLRDVATRLVELVAADARQRGVAIEADVGAEPAIVEGDRDQLAQVSLNVALNAMRAIGERGGKIRVRVERSRPSDAGMHALHIENDGPPIPEAEIEHLFDPFHSGHPDGTGLGLSISERIMEQHGGYIEAANRGLGVEFTLHVPPLR